MITQLRTGKLLFRPFEEKDIEPCYQAVRESFKELSTYMTWCHPDYCVEDTAGWIRTRESAWHNREEYDFVIVDEATGSVLGTVGLNQINRPARFANLGYWVRTSATGGGIASMAAREIAKFGLTELGLQRIEIVVATNNKGSQRVAEKAGARREGILRKRISLHGQPQDAVMYSLILEDFLPQN